MTREMMALSRRAVACKGWRWMAGMATQTDGCDNRVIEVEVNDHWGYGMESVPVRMAYRLIGDACCEQWREHDILPDFTDPATLGCLLALVRDAWDCPTLYVEHEHTSRVHECDPKRPYHVSCGDGTHIHGIWTSEVEALVQALESAALHAKPKMPPELQAQVNMWMQFGADAVFVLGDES